MSKEAPVIIREQFDCHSYTTPWGEVLEHHIESDSHIISKISINPGAIIPVHEHFQDGHDTIVDGDGWILVSDQRIRVENGRIEGTRVEISYSEGGRYGYEADSKGLGLEIWSISKASWKENSSS